MSNGTPPVSGNNRIRSRQNVILVVITAILLIGGGIAMFMTGNKPTVASSKPETTNIQAPGTIDQQNAWRAISEARQKDLEDRVKALSGDLAAAKKDLATTASATAAAQAAAASAASAAAAAPRPVSDAAANVAVGLNKPLPAGAVKPGRGLGGQRVLNPPGMLNQPLSADIAPTRQLEIIDFDDATDGNASAPGAIKTGATPANASKAANKQVNLLPAGSFIPVAMLNGVDAPTGGQAQSDPLSVDLHILRPASLPNNKRLDLTACRVISSVWGDLSSERMMGRTQKLSCVLGDRAVELDIKGKLIGEDGKEGVRGRLVTKQGSILAHALLAGTLSGVGQAFQQSSMVTSYGGGGISQTFDGSRIGSAAVGGGVGGAANMLAQYYLKTADKLFPVIETDAARTIEIEVLTGLNVDADTAALFSDRHGRDRNRLRSAHD